MEVFLLQLLLNGLYNSLNLMLMVVGFSLIFGILRIANLAYGELYTLGAFAVWFFTTKGLPYGLAFVPAIAIVVLVGVVLEKYVFRRYRSFLLPSLIVSIALVGIFRTAILLGVDALGFGLGSQAMPTVFRGQLVILGASISWERVVVAMAGISVLLGGSVFVYRTKLGKGIRAFAQDPELASMLGVKGLSTVAMIIASALAAVLVGLHAPMYGLTYTMGFELLLTALIAVSLGGMGSLAGAILGAFIIGFSQSLVSTLWSPQFGVLALFVVLFGVLLLRPRGLFGFVMHVE